MEWNEISQKSKREQRPVEQVFQEELQKCVLTALNREKLFQEIVFQGGTALRLFYGNPRFSEDLDFVLNEGNSKVDLSKYQGSFHKFTKDTFPFLEEIRLETQKSTEEFQRLILKTKSPSLPRSVRLHLELARVPSYLNDPRILDFPPFNPAVQVEEKTEIMADKITALFYRDYLKGRDLWDVYFLHEEKEIKIDSDLVNKKIDDYGFKVSNLGEKKKNIVKKIEDNGLKTLEAELNRFLPNTQYEQYQENFDDIISKVAEIMKNIDISKIKEGDSSEGE